MTAINYWQNLLPKIRQKNLMRRHTGITLHRFICGKDSLGSRNCAVRRRKYFIFPRQHDGTEFRCSL